MKKRFYHSRGSVRTSKDVNFPTPTKEFNLSDKVFSSGVATEDVKEFIKIIEKEVDDAQMYADMDEDDFWATSTISPQEAQKRADYWFELFKIIKKRAGEKLI